MARLTDVIADNIDEIAAEWAREARQEVSADAAIAALVLLDYIPDLLAQLVRWLQQDTEPEAWSYWEAAHKHALGRLDLDFELREVTQQFLPEV